MNWEDYRFLLAIERGEGVAGAARELEVDKATVRRHVESMERDVGQPLVARRSTGWVLTEAGTRLAAAARAMEEAATLASRDLAAETSAAVVRVTAPAWVARNVIMPELGEFRRQEPDITLRVLATNELLDISKRETDVAIRNVKPEAQGIIFRKIGVLGSCAYASRAYIREHGLPSGREDWSGHDLLAYEHAVCYGSELRWMQNAKAEIVFRASDPAVLIGAALNGLGIGALPCVLADAEGELVRVIDELASESIYLCLAEELREFQPVRKVADWLADLFVSKGDVLSGRRMPALE